MKKRFFIFIAVSMLVFNSSRLFAYQEIEVKNGGTIQGKATLTGEMPTYRSFHLVMFPNQEMCAKVDNDGEMNRLLDDFIIDASNGLKNVVVTIEHMEAGKSFPEKKPLQILSENCKFTPDVNVIEQGGSFSVDNKDSVMHNSQVYQSERGKIILNIPIPAEEVSSGAIHFQKDYKIFQMICGMHEFMQTWGFRVQNPYYQVTSENGNFKIDNIPPGDYVVTAWHYLMPVQSQKIHVTEKSSSEINFSFDGDKVIRPMYETIKSGRIKKDARGRMQIQ